MAKTRSGLGLIDLEKLFHSSMQTKKDLIHLLQLLLMANIGGLTAHAETVAVRKNNHN